MRKNNFRSWWPRVPELERSSLKYNNAKKESPIQVLYEWLNPYKKQQTQDERDQLILTFGSHVLKIKERLDNIEKNMDKFNEELRDNKTLMRKMAARYLPNIYPIFTQYLPK